MQNCFYCSDVIYNIPMSFALLRAVLMNSVFWSVKSYLINFFPSSEYLVDIKDIPFEEFCSFFLNSFYLFTYVFTCAGLLKFCFTQDFTTNVGKFFSIKNVFLLNSHSVSPMV